MNDFPIDPPSDFPTVLDWENAVNEDDPTTPILYRGGNIITGQILFLFCLGRSERELDQHC
jgi:hypothetical protein